MTQYPLTCPAKWFFLFCGTWILSIPLLPAQSIPTAPCQIVPQKRLFSLNELTQVCSDDLIREQANFFQPAPDGSIGLNREGFRHLAHQAPLLATIQWAVDQQSLSTLELGLAAIDYSLHQSASSQQPALLPALAQPLSTALDSAYWLQSSVHFAAALGCALLSLRESRWAWQQPALTQRVKRWEAEIRQGLTFLLDHQHYLALGGGQSAGRLLSASMAFYSLGTYLNHAPAQAVGLTFLTQVLDLQHPAGYFLEQGGWNTAANAQLLETGFALLCLLPAKEPLALRWFTALGCSLYWQAGRTNQSGQVNTLGDTSPADDPLGLFEVPAYAQYHRNLKALLLGYFFTDDPKFYSLAHKVKMTRPRPASNQAGLAPEER